MIDNLKLIKPLLIFESKDDFYYLQILQRKKENPQLGSNSRVIKNYYINSIEYLENHYEEIKNLCTLFNARAMLRLNKRSYRKVSFRTMSNIANCASNQEYEFVKKCYDRACGECHNDKNKKWIIDIDIKLSTEELNLIIDYINNINPKESKIYTVLNTKNGIHLITKPFNLTIFKEKYLFDIHKDNPINLFIP